MSIYYGRFIARIEPILYRIKELPKVLGVGQSKIDQWVKEGRIETFLIDGTRFCTHEDVEKFIATERAKDIRYKIGGAA